MRFSSAQCQPAMMVSCWPGGVDAQTTPQTVTSLSELPPIEVIGASPLIGSGIDRERRTGGDAPC